MKFKNLEELQKAISQHSIDQPLIVVISGKDTQIFNLITEFVEKKIFSHKSVEITVLTGESEDFSMIVNDLWNFSLFANYRLYILKQAHLIFKSFRNFRFKEIPPATWILIEYEGNIPAKLFAVPESYIFHYETKILYEKQVDSLIHNLAKRYNLIFSDEAISEMKTLFPPKESLYQIAIFNIAKNIDFQGKKPYYITYEDIRNVFYPSGGWDIFRIIDACFRKDLETFLVEIEKYNPLEDNYYSLLKNLLNKTEELRKYHIARKLNMDAKETLRLIGADTKPTFIQKKILSQLEHTHRLFPLEKLKSIYNFLVEVAFGFRQNIEEDYKKNIFIKKAIEIFFL